ncbi:hypothetical protein CK203_089869 [Vitis vinifera]|uniref:Retrovirus-related Pol polyprotein from transposon TNT 1-94-like beta-barrel domain-containing protein n=1 Tax=Vitis vinifera TaxID=29760 RepID=A0A438FLK6_VITVI|nr:hypothetical protein CK203_089869 [Vitis vinifera]
MTLQFFGRKQQTSVNFVGEWVMWSCSAATHLINPSLDPHNFKPATLEISQDTNWYLDSGAMNHLTSDLNNLMTKTQFFASDQVFVGNGQGLSIHYIGHVSFSSPFVPSKSLALKQLLHIP